MKGGGCEKLIIKEYLKNSIADDAQKPTLLQMCLSTQTILMETIFITFYCATKKLYIKGCFFIIALPNFV